MANAAPAVSVGLTLAALAAAAAYAVGPIIVLTAIPMLIIANTYRRLNLWKAQCGASFEWVGRSINPYLGFMTGWLMITGTLVGVVSGVVVLAPSVLAVFGSTSTSTWPNILISTAILLIMVVIAIVGIRITARIQVGMGLIEYVILIGFAITGLVLVLSHHHGTFPITKGWFTVSGSEARAASRRGSSSRCSCTPAGTRVFTSTRLLAAIHPRFSTPAVATLIIGAILVVVTWIYLLSTSVANAFTQVIDVTGLLYAAFYVLTAFAAVTYFRRRIVSNAADLVLVGISRSRPPRSWSGWWSSRCSPRRRRSSGPWSGWSSSV
jgi:amino acid transporter